MSQRKSFEEVKKTFHDIVNSLDHEAKSVILTAYKLAETEHEGQLRKEHKDRPGDRDPYLIHPMRVSLVVMNELKLRDVTAIASAVLHDVVEDGNSRPSLESIHKEFGDAIGTTVGYLTKPEFGEAEPDASKLIPYHESFFSAPLHVRMVKLSDRLDNLRESLLVDRPKFQHRYLKETREIYIPIAKQTSTYFTDELNRHCDQLAELLGA